MTYEQLNEFINKGNAAALLLAIAVILFLIYFEIAHRHSKK